jgi:hypothetical protein
MTMIRWYYGLIYMPWKWLTGEQFPSELPEGADAEQIQGLVGGGTSMGGARPEAECLVP